MRIAMLAPIAWRVPPRHYGPWEQIVSLLTEGLVAQGVEVTLFATEDSKTSATLEAICPRPYEEAPELDPKAWECLHIARVFERAGEFDLIHNHFDFLPLSYSGLVQTPLVTTVHGFSSERILPVYRRYNGTCHYVSISDADRRPELDYLATVHHGIDIHDFEPCESPEDYLLFFGRIHPDKGAAEAIGVARASGHRLIIAGIVQDRAYFEKEVAPHVDGRQVIYLGPVGPETKSSLLGGAVALLHLIDCAEPFGLSMVEAMACGTPVVATRRGSVPEVVSHGLSGLIVDGPEQAAAAVSEVGSLDRRAVRAYAEHRFSRDRMVADYLEVYRKILAN